MFTGAWEASKQAATQMFPSVNNWMDTSGGGVAELVLPASTAVGVSIVAWLLLPAVFRKLHSTVSGVALQFSRPFTVGDIISAGSVTGQVVDMGLHTTQLLNSDKFPIVVPNSFFSNQATDGYLAAQEDLLIEAARIFAKTGVKFGDPLNFVSLKNYLAHSVRLFHPSENLQICVMQHNHSAF